MVVLETQYTDHADGCVFSRALMILLYSCWPSLRFPRNHQCEMYGASILFIHPQPSPSCPTGSPYTNEKFRLERPLSFLSILHPAMHGSHLYNGSARYPAILTAVIARDPIPEMDKSIYPSSSGRSGSWKPLVCRESCGCVRMHRPWKKQHLS